MRAEEVVERFRRTGALLEGHFVLTSGLRSTHYLQCALVLQNPSEAEAFGRAIAERFTGQSVETVVAPAACPLRAEGVPAVKPGSRKQ